MAGSNTQHTFFPLRAIYPKVLIDNPYLNSSTITFVDGSNRDLTARLKVAERGYYVGTASQLSAFYHNLGNSKIA